MQIDDGGFRGGATGQEAVAELGVLLREKEKTKRLLIAAACLLFIVASMVIVFAPAGKETASVILGVVLIIFALGAIGAAAFKIKAGGVEVSTTNEIQVAPAKNGSSKTPA
ncbi:hypothetical protein [Undibacterium sp. Xuan67W]|uniref:hypothetical protein n=1 Tax=Undibacterium sp. Xuan67W TaxID=3413057 RepID=UPI003BF012BE